MLTWGEDVEVHALHERGWSISAIARHLGRDRKTIRAYVRGERAPGTRRRQAADPLAPFVGYLAARFADDPHIWASALYRRGDPARLRAELCELRPPAAPARAASPLRGVPGGQGSGHDRDRPSAGRGDAVGLVRAPPGAVGRHRVRAAGHPAALGAGAWGARRVAWTSPT